MITSNNKIKENYWKFDNEIYEMLNLKSYRSIQIHVRELLIHEFINNSHESDSDILKMFGPVVNVLNSLG